MSRKVLAVVTLAVVAALGAATMEAQQSRPWIHVQVIEPGEDGTNARVNLPLALAEVALSLVSDEVISKGQIKFDEHDISVEDLRLLWNELKASGDAEFLTMQQKDKQIRIARQGDRIRIHLDKSAEGDEDEGDKQVRIEVPVTLVDALLGGQGDRLDLRAALAELTEERGDIVTVSDGEKRVRVWIDESKS